MGVTIATFSVPVTVAWYEVKEDFSVPHPGEEPPLQLRQGDWLIKDAGKLHVRHTPGVDVSGAQSMRHQGRLYAMSVDPAVSGAERKALGLVSREWDGAFVWIPLAILYNE